jgi:hypothetical protein
MGRKIDADGLVGSREIARRVGAKRPEHVHWWVHHDALFPAPVAVLGSGTGRKTYVWYWPDVERWARRTGRLARSAPPGGRQR